MNKLDIIKRQGERIAQLKDLVKRLQEHIKKNGTIPNSEHFPMLLYLGMYGITGFFLLVGGVGQDNVYFWTGMSCLFVVLLDRWYYEE